MATYRIFLCESRFTSDRAEAVVRPAFNLFPGVLLSTLAGSCVSAVSAFPTLSTLSVTSCQLIICRCLTRSPLKPFFCLYLCPAVVTTFSTCVCAGTAASAPRLFPVVGVQCADCGGHSNCASTTPIFDCTNQTAFSVCITVSLKYSASFN